MNTPVGKILVVDDDLRGLAFLKGLLNSEGYDLLTAGDGAEAIAKAADYKPDAILLDVMMPGMDGFEACRRLRADKNLGQVPILLLTALDDRESKLEGLSAGADDFLTKPFDSTELLLRLRTITRLNRFRRLSEERLRFEEMVSLSPDGIVLLDATGSILLANREFARMGDLQSPEEGVGQDFFEWLTPDHGALLKGTIEKLRDRGGPQVLELLIQVSDPLSTPVELSLGLIPWDGRTVFQCLLRDLTEKKRMEAQLLRFQRIDLLGELAGSIVHDMNNVLGAVSGNLNLLEMQLTLPADAKDRMEIIQQSLTRGNGILRQLLNFTRGSDGSLQPVDISEIVREVVNLITPMIKYDYQIKVDLQPDLPVIEADANQLHQVFMNLCVNARDAMPRGGTLTMEGRIVKVLTPPAGLVGGDASPGDYVCISISDTGTGMTPAIREKIFAPFFTTKEPGKGTGLGLATVMRLVCRHKGFIVLDSALGVGTSFRCHFPVAT